MHDMVEIGLGRAARRTYELDDINIVPSRRTRSSKDVSTSWQLAGVRHRAGPARRAGRAQR